MEQQAIVMVVDDDQTMTSTLAKILGVAGYSVITAESGDAALAIMRQECPDLVIADLKMNGMSGHELQSEIARRSPDVPVVIITAFGSMEGAVESMRGWPFHLITKSFTQCQLKSGIETATVDSEIGRQREWRCGDSRPCDWGGS